MVHLTYLVVDSLRSMGNIVGILNKIFKYLDLYHMLCMWNCIQMKTETIGVKKNSNFKPTKIPKNTKRKRRGAMHLGPN